MHLLFIIIQMVLSVEHWANGRESSDLSVEKVAGILYW